MAAKRNNKSFLLQHVSLMALVLILAFVGLNWFLKAYTRQGVHVQVPHLQGQLLDDVKPLLDSLQLRYHIMDSTYVDTLPGGIILRQHPLPGTEVKPERTIYLVISAYRAPLVKMPDLRDLPLETAQSLLQQHRLKIKRIIYRPDVAHHVVLEQLQDGRPIPPGTPVPVGSAITLVVGVNEQGLQVVVPDVRCQTLQQAVQVLQMQQLSAGAVVSQGPPIEDTLAAFVIAQQPEAGEQVPAGTPVDVIISVQSPLLCAEPGSF